jgi:DNA-binding MarR family transcriptional regulator
MAMSAKSAYGRAMNKQASRKPVPYKTPKEFLLGLGKAKDVQPMRVIGSIFRVRRDLTLLIKKHVLPGSGLTLEEVDLLLDLYGAAKLGWSDPKADEQGFVTWASAKASLVHSSAGLSRCVAALKQAGLLETRKLHEIAVEKKVDRRSLVLRITGKGIEKVEPVHQRYAELCERLLKDFSPEAQETVLETNEKLMQKARWGV